MLCCSRSRHSWYFFQFSWYCSEDCFFAAGQGELERRVDAFQGLVEVAHEDHAVVVLVQDLVDLLAEVIDQECPCRPQRDQQDEEGNHGHEDAAAEGHNGSCPWANLEFQISRFEFQIPYFFRLRYNVLGSMPSFAAASSIVAVVARMRRMCSASSCSSVIASGVRPRPRGALAPGRE